MPKPWWNARTISGRPVSSIWRRPKVSKIGPEWTRPYAFERSMDRVRNKSIGRNCGCVRIGPNIDNSPIRASWTHSGRYRSRTVHWTQLWLRQNRTQHRQQSYPRVLDPLRTISLTDCLRTGGKDAIRILSEITDQKWTVAQPARPGLIADAVDGRMSEDTSTGHTLRLVGIGS